MKALAPENDLQARFQEIGLPEPLMVELQITDFELPWDPRAQLNRTRFLEQGYILVVDRRAGATKTYLKAPGARGEIRSHSLADRAVTE